MRHITGSTIAKPNTVKVEFMSDEHGAILFVSTSENTAEKTNLAFCTQRSFLSEEA